VKLLITGKRDKFWKAVGTAFAKQAGIRATVLPIGSPVIATVRSTPLDVVLYTLSSEGEFELLRWILQINPSLPLIALLPAANAQLQKQILEEGAADVLVVPSLDAGEIRKNIVGPRLRTLQSKRTSSGVRRQISDDLHAIRSALTAILGTAEMAMKRSLPAARTRKHIQEIPNGVMEIEKILRRIHRTIKSNPPTRKQIKRSS
jgi:CheY-like chemotaxis protein